MPLRDTFSPSHEPGRDARDNCEWWHVASHHRAGPHDGTAADGDAWKNRRVRADVSPCANADRSNLEIRLHDGHVDGLARVSRAEHLCPGPPPDVVLDDEISGIHVRLRSNPDVVANDRRAVKAAL